MRLIPGKTKVQIELFKGVSLWDILVGAIAMVLAILVIISSLPGKIVILSIVLFFAFLLIMRLDEQPNYVMLLHMFQHYGLKRKYRKVYSDEMLKKKAKNELVDEYLEDVRRKNEEEEEEYEYEEESSEEAAEEEDDTSYDNYNGYSYSNSYAPSEAEYTDEDLRYHDDTSELRTSSYSDEYYSDDESTGTVKLEAKQIKIKEKSTINIKGAKPAKEEPEDEGSDEEPAEAKLSLSELRKQDAKLRKEEDKILRSSKYTKEDKDAVWLARANRSAAIKQAKLEAKSEATEGAFQPEFMDQIMAFTGIKDGYIEYGGKYFGTVIEVDPVEFRFFSEHRRKNSIEGGLGRVLRGVHVGFSANIIKIERPVIYDNYLAKEEAKLDDIRKSFESGVMNEEEFKARVSIVKDRIDDLRDMCFENKVVTPFYYIALFESDKKQLDIMTASALDSLISGELKVRKLENDKELAIFLKYTNAIDFDEREVDEISPEDYAQWAMPDTVNFKFRTTEVNGIITHNMRVVNYPTMVGDAYLAGVLSQPGIKVVIKCSPMDRGKAVRTIDRSLQELRGQYNATGVDSKRIELETHIASLSELLATLQSEGEELMECNIYVTAYDWQLTKTSGTVLNPPKKSILPLISAMKKNVRRSFQEANFRLNNMEFEQIQAFIASQVSAYDPKEKEGRGIPTNSIAAGFPWVYAHISDEGGFKLGVSEGVPVFINFFRRDNERVNSNMVVIGKSGSGKSYATKSLLANLAAEDAKIFILDPENEYSELAHNLNGKIINVANAQFGRMNPFHIITALDDDEAGGGVATGSFATHLQFLEEFYRQILPDIDKDALEYLNTLTERLYTNRGITPETDLASLTPDDYPIFDDLYDAVLSEFERTDNEYIRSLLRTLINYVSKFSTGGRNANIWNGPSTVTTDENFTVFNFQSMLSNRNTTIANAQMLLVLKYIDNEIIKNRDYNKKYKLNRKVVVVIDEAHVFIDEKYPIALDFMFQLAKRIRKYNGMQIVITQNIKDFVGSEEIARKSTAIINACQYSFIFALAPNDIQDLCKLYEKAGGINENEQEQITQAPRGQAFTIMSPTSRSTFKVEVPKDMVDMFQNEDYHSTRFGEDGENWDDFVGVSRELYEENFRENKRAEEVMVQFGQEEAKKRVIFEEIGEEEAPEVFDIGTKGRTDGRYSIDFEEEEFVPSHSSGKVSFEEESFGSSGVTFEEETEDLSYSNYGKQQTYEAPRAAYTAPAPQYTAPAPQYTAPAAPLPPPGGVTVTASDYNTMIEEIRAQAMKNITPRETTVSADSVDVNALAEKLRSEIMAEIMEELRTGGTVAGLTAAGAGAAAVTAAAAASPSVAAASAAAEEPEEEISLNEDLTEDDFGFDSDLFTGDFDESTSSLEEPEEEETETESDSSDVDFDDMDFSLLFSGAEMSEDESESDSDDDDFDIMALLRSEAATRVAETEITDIDEIVGLGEVTEITLSELAVLVRLQREARRHSSDV